jgi:hypothetical protein
MTKLSIIGIIISLLMIGSVFVLMITLKRDANSLLVAFYKACDEIRERIHKATSKAERREILDDLQHIEDTFVMQLPVAVTQKEMNLLYRLLEKKDKKLK